MFYVVDKYRILAESEIPVQMKDYPDCELIEGPPGVSMINFEVCMEKGIKKIKTKLILNAFDIDVSIPGIEQINGAYEIKVGGEPIEIEIKLSGVPYIPPLFIFPENFDPNKNNIDISCSRGKLSTNVLAKSGIVKWTPVDETVECSIIVTALNFPPIQKFITIKLI